MNFRTELQYLDPPQRRELPTWQEANNYFNRGMSDFLQRVGQAQHTVGVPARIEQPRHLKPARAPPRNPDGLRAYITPDTASLFYEQPKCAKFWQPEMGEIHSAPNGSDTRNLPFQQARGFLLH